MSHLQFNTNILDLVQVLDTPEMRMTRTVEASRKEYSGCIDYDHACPYDSTSGQCISVSSIGHGLYLLECLSPICALLHNGGIRVTTSCKD